MIRRRAPSSRTRARDVFALGVVCVAALCGGCMTVGNYTTPRALPAGDVTHTVAFEWVGIAGKDPRVERGFVSPPTGFPAYLIRYGLPGRMDVGAKFSTALNTGADLKIELLRAHGSSMALDPSLAASTKNALAIVPLSLSFEILEDIASVWLSPRVAWGFAFNPDDKEARRIHGFMAGAALGYRLAMAHDVLSVQPEFGVLRGFEGGGTWIITGGIGFTFGEQADYSALQ